MLTLVGPTLLSLALGLWGITRQDSMWRDESVTYQVAHRSWAETWDLLQNIDAVHGLYYVVMHVVFSIGGDGLSTLRLPSAVGMALATAGVAAIGLRLEGIRTAVVSASVFAALPVVQQYGQEGRSYALVTACVVWASYFFVRALATGRRRDWISYTLLLILASWLHEFAALIVLPHIFVLITWPQARPQRRAAVSAFACCAAFLAPLALFSQAQAEQQLSWLGRPSAAVWIQFGMIALVGGGCQYYVRRQSAPHSTGLLPRLALSSLVLPPALLMILSLIKPWYLERYVVYAMSGLALLVGSAAHHAWEHMRRTVPHAVVERYAIASLCAAIAVAVLVPWSLLVRSPESRKDDTVAIATAVHDVSQQDDGLLFMPSRRREWMMSWPATYAPHEDLALAHSPQDSGTLQGVERSAADIRQAMLHKDRIIALKDPAGQPLDQTAQERMKRDVLRDYFKECSRQVVRGAQVTLWSKGTC